MTAKYIAVGSPTLNNNMMPSVSSFLTYFKGLTGNKKSLSPSVPTAGGGQSPQQVYDQLTACKAEALLPAIKLAYKPSAEQLDKIAADVTEAVKPTAWNNAETCSALPTHKRTIIANRLIVIKKEGHRSKSGGVLPFYVLHKSASSSSIFRSEQAGEQVSPPDRTHIPVVRLVAGGIIVPQHAAVSVIQHAARSRFPFLQVSDRLHIDIVQFAHPAFPLFPDLL